MEPTPEQTAFMAKNWRDLIRPRMLEIEERSETYGKFSCEPLERGFGTTLGTGLRRVLLSSLQGAAISQIAIEGALHEFTSLPGVVEDVTDIILNFKETLLKVDNYDFNWQLAYRMAKPVQATPGSKIEATAWYDNSANNAANPDPKATVKWGEQSWEEMMMGFFDVAIDVKMDPMDLYRPKQKKSDD